MSVSGTNPGNKNHGQVGWVLGFIDGCQYISPIQLSLLCSHRKDLASKPEAIQILHDDTREIAGSRGDAKNSDTLRVEELFE